jgi:hypothetical protein
LRYGEAAYSYGEPKWALSKLRLYARPSELPKRNTLGIEISFVARASLCSKAGSVATCSRVLHPRRAPVLIRRADNPQLSVKMGEMGAYAVGLVVVEQVHQRNEAAAVAPFLSRRADVLRIARAVKVRLLLQKFESYR